MIKRRCLILFVFYIVIILIGQYGKSKFTDVGIEFSRRLDDFEDRQVQLEDGLESKKKYTQHYQKYFDYYVSTWDESTCIIIGEPTGVYRSDSYSGIQEIRVTKVLKGENEIYCGQNIQVAGVDGFKWSEQEKMTMYSGYCNLMQEGNSYMIFLHPYQISSGLYKEENVKLGKLGYEDYYVLSSGYFSYLNMDKDTKSVMPENKEFVYRYGDIKQYEFFCKEKMILEIKNKIKHEIITRCMKKYSGSKNFAGNLH